MIDFEDRFGLTPPADMLVGIGRAIPVPVPDPVATEPKVYDPQRVELTFNGIKISGFSTDASIHVQPQDDEDRIIVFPSGAIRTTGSITVRQVGPSYFKRLRRAGMRYRRRARIARRGWA